MKLSISLALGLALAACSSPFDWSGEWEGTLGPTPQNAIEGTARRVQLSVPRSKDPVLTCLGFPAEGVLETSGREATFIGKSVMGQPIDRQSPAVREIFASVTFKVVSADTIEATLKQPEGPLTVTLRRKPQPASKG